MSEEASHRSAVAKEEWQIANATGGIFAWKEIDQRTRGVLRDAGFLRVDDVRDAFYTGALQKTSGIGATRIARIAFALAGEGA